MTPSDSGETANDSNHVIIASHSFIGTMNPMLLNAQLQATMLYGSQFNPGLLQVQQAAATAERLRAMANASSGAVPPTSSSSNRYSPYPLPSPPKSSMSLSSPTSSSAGSAFSAVKKQESKAESSSSPKPEKEPSNDPIEKKPMETEESSTKNSANKNEDLASDIQNMEKLVNGLNGSSASKFGISHNNNDQQISA